MRAFFQRRVRGLPRLRHLLGMALLGSLAANGVARADGIALGQQIPAALRTTAMKNVDGKQVTIGQIAGKKGTLVIFTCNHCPWAKAWQQRIAALGNAYAKKGVGVVAVNANDPTVYAEDDYAHTQARARKLRLRFPYVIDATSSVARGFGASHTPEAYLFDRSGKLVYHGAIDDNAEKPKAVRNPYLRNALAEVVAGKPVRVAETKAIGCSIKFRSQREQR